MRHVLFAAFAGLLIACSTQTGIIPQLRAYVRVQNDHWLDHVIYANCGGRIRVGVSGGVRQTLLRIPRGCEDRETAFAADPIGSYAVSRSDAMPVVAGDVLSLRIPAFFNGYLILYR